MLLQAVLPFPPSDTLAVLRAVRGNPLRLASSVAAPASCVQPPQEPAPSQDRSAPDKAHPVSQIVLQPPGAHGSGASRHRCQRGSSSLLPQCDRSAQTWPSKPALRSRGVPPTSSGCIPTAQHAEPNPPSVRLRSP